MNRSRNEQVAFQLRQSGLDALVCTLPKNVLLLSGYWPVVGTGAAIALPDGEVRLIIPEDEQEFAVQSRASNVQTFNPSSLEKLTNPTEAILEPLRVHLRQFGEHHRIGYEHGADSEPASYAAMHLYQSTMPELIAKAAPGANIIAADHLLKELRSIKTEDELSAIRTACRIAQHGFEQGVKAISPGNTEIEAAAEIRAHFVAGLRRSPGVRRAEAFVFVMSGKNSAKAHGAFAHSSRKTIETGDLVLVHCNSAADGYYTDITRTFVLGSPDAQCRAMYDAVFSARKAALHQIRAGSNAADVDRAARTVMSQAGFGANFKHATGHGVGFGAIDPGALPRLHPKSNDVLKPGMVFNVEPAIYIQGYGGIRHCDMVAVTDEGFELLTPFQSQPLSLMLGTVTPAPGSRPC